MQIGPPPYICAAQDPTTLTLPFLTQTVHDYVPNYRPRELKLERQKTEGARALFEGRLDFGPASSATTAKIRLIREGTKTSLEVDSNGNGAFDAADGAPIWNRESDGTEKGYFEVEVNKRRLRFYAYIVPNADQKDIEQLNICPDYGPKGKFKAKDGKEYRILLYDWGATADFTFPRPVGKEGPHQRLEWWVDLNMDGAFQENESRSFYQTLEIGGAAYQMEAVSADGSEIRLRSVPLPLASRPETRPYRPIVGVQAPALEGEIIGSSDEKPSQLSLAKDFKGKIVLVDFWATWCAPCLRDLPDLVHAQEKFHERGLRLLGVSRDLTEDSKRAEMRKKIRELMADKMATWPQFHDWDGKLGRPWGIESLPDLFLIDGDSGKVLATSDQLRGEQLLKTLESVFDKIKK